MIASFSAVLDKPLGHLSSNQAKQDRDHEEQPFRPLIPWVRLLRLGKVRLGIVLLVRLHASSYTKKAPQKSQDARQPAGADNASHGQSLSQGDGIRSGACSIHAILAHQEPDGGLDQDFVERRFLVVGEGATGAAERRQISRLRTLA